MPATARRYHAGETDAIVRRCRGYLKLLDDDEIPADRKRMIVAVIAADFRALDEFLSSGRPLPSQWMEGRKVVKVASQGGEASAGKIASKEEGK